ncbi:MAG: DNA mismatch repair endonuclease MutL [Chloroflexi bacterium]|nr:DNA mismatch repair endonuclease MutL [Chloroflexota bacterium]
MPIHQLAPSVAAKIAAGEVIERPASVVKELVENALDAGATEIAVELAEGGLRLIRVRDNGCGLPPEEVPLAFQRHATSKISRAEDLLQIATLGFRGEALPSIAAVADVTFITRPRLALGGYLFHTRGERILAQTSRAAPAGTMVTVRDLFVDYPARRKFLRSPATEAAHCTTVVAHYALAQPEVRFSLTLDGKRVLQTPGAGELRAAAAAVLGTAIAASLLEVSSEDLDSGRQEQEGSPIRVVGLASPPGVTRASRGQISLFVNGRWVQSRALAFAVEEAYQGALMTGRHPVAILHLTLQPGEVDVNVHPRKLEVRFLRERDVFAGVQRAMRHALVAAQPPGLQPIPAPAATRAYASPFSEPVAHQAPLLTPLPEPGAAGAQGPGPTSSAVSRLPVLRVLGQVSGTYIIAEGPDGMYLVDQHAAHERVQYERVLGRLERQFLEQQWLLEPQVVEVSGEAYTLLLGGQPDLERVGLLLEAFGERQVLVRSLPAGVREKEARQVLEEIAERLRSPQGLQERLAATVACHSAVRAGDVLGQDEQRQLILDLEACQAPHTCPHGRPTMIHLSAAQLQREFGRRG